MPNTSKSTSEGTKKRNSASGYRGVYRVRNSKLRVPKWYASFRGVYLGTYETPEDAARAYNKVAIAAGYSGQINVIPGDPETLPAPLDKDDIKKLIEQDS